MKNAIITGSSGLVGRSLARNLEANGVKVLCLGRRSLESNEVRKIFGKNVNYIPLQMSNISDLPQRIADLDWTVGEQCVFFHLAWSGAERLADGSDEDQFKNVAHSAAAVKVAKKLGCIKFINSGTVEETYLEWHVANSVPYTSSQRSYATAKLASRDMCSMVAYLEKIDYVHTRLSVPISRDLYGEGYIQKTLRKIIGGTSYENPTSSQLYDITLVDDVSAAYHFLALKGKNKRDYFIGTGIPTTLSHFFENVHRLVRGLPLTERSYPDSYSAAFFDTSLLFFDTGFNSMRSVYEQITGDSIL